MDTNIEKKAAYCNVPDVADWWHLLSPSEQVYYFCKAVVLSKPKVALAYGLMLMGIIGIFVFILQHDAELAGWIIMLAVMCVVAGFIMAWHIDRN